MPKDNIVLKKFNQILKGNYLFYYLIFCMCIFTTFRSNSQSLDYISNRMNHMANGEVMVRKAYMEVTNLKLKNEHNISKYKSFVSNKTISLYTHRRVKRKIVSQEFTYLLINQFNTYINTVDLSNYNIASDITTQLELILNDPSIKKELQITNAILNEISAIKYAHPNNYYNIERYSEMLEAMKYLKSCDLDSLDDMFFKYKLY